MKIIEHGDPNKISKRDLYRAKCDRCGCVFIFHWAEAHHECDYITRHTVRCPECFHEMDMMHNRQVRSLEDIK